MPFPSAARPDRRALLGALAALPSLFASSAFAASPLLAASPRLAASPGLARPRTVTDVLGRTVTLTKPAERVMLGFYFEDFLAIAGPGGADRLAAISTFYWKGYRPNQYEAYVAALPGIAGLVDVGDVDSGTMSAEKIVAARPDVAILSGGQYEYLGQTAAVIEAAGIPIVVVDYNAQTVAKHVASTLAIGQVMGTEDRAERLAAAYAAKVADTLARVAGAGDPRRRVYVELGQKGPADYDNSYGRGMWAGVIDAAGGLNIAAGQIGAYGPLRPEYVLATRPEVIVVAGSEWVTRPNALLLGFGIPPETTRERLRAYLDRAGWDALPAVRTGEVYALYHGGARTLSDTVYLRYMAKALHPEAFRDVDPQAELAAYYRENLPVAPDGTFMLRLEPGP